MAKRDIILQITVRVPAATGESDVANALNAALDETPDNGLFWDDWTVGPLTVIDAQPVPDDEEGDQP